MKDNYRTYETEMLVMKYKQEKNEEILQEIMERCKGIVYELSVKYSKSILGTEVEDLVSEGNIVLWDAAQTWDEERGASFTTYLYSCLCRNYNTLYKIALSQKRNPKGFVESFEQMNSNSEFEEEGDTLGNREFSVECEDYSMVEIRMLLDELDLSDREKTVVSLLVSGNSKPEIARYLGVKTPSVHSYVKRVGKKLIASGLCA